MSEWIKSNKHLVGTIASLVFLVFGILVIIGAIKDWDWLYKPDGHYQNRWTLGQVSRYLGRRPARVIGFIGGLLVTFAGAYWSYLSIFKN